MNKDNPSNTDNSENNGSSSKTEEDGSNNEITPKEFGGRKGPDPVRYGDWEIAGKCIDF